ncbi:hypothetical protein CC78DRAFT_530182, partial [Lojkania enalia]
MQALRWGGRAKALEFATHSALIPILGALLDASAEIKSHSVHSDAAGRGRFDAIAFLLKRGTDINEILENDDIGENARELEVKNTLCSAA